MNPTFLMSACALAACLALGDAQAQASAQTTPQAGGGETELQRIVITGKRANRVSKGATGLPMEIKDTPQTISTIDQEDIANYGLTGANDALRLGTGINVEQYETNRAVYNARGFEIQNTQVDGLGISNSWGTAVGQQETFIYERIELIRGANGLLTGVGNASGTINYVRKRPLNKDGGLAVIGFGAHNNRRLALDVNKVLSEDGSWAGRLIVAHEDKDSHLRALNDKRSTVYGVIDGQVGENGTLTAGVTLTDAKQRSPMWGSLVLLRTDGSQAEFDSSASTSVDWTYWNTKSQTAFVEYTHSLASGWEAKFSYSHRENQENTKLLYAYGVLNPDNTGLSGWAYRGHTNTYNDVLDGNISGEFSAWGLKHSLLAGLSYSRQRTATDLWAVPAGSNFLALPAFPYGGNAFPEPAWDPRTPDSATNSKLTRFYGAARLGVTEKAKLILGVNAVRLERGGGSLYGNTGATVTDPKTDKVSPYLGATYDISPDTMGYVSYSDIFQNQDQTDAQGRMLAPMKGLNAEAGVKAEWLNKQLLTTFAVFTAKQEGLATYTGQTTSSGQYIYEPKDVKSRGFEMEATGRISKDSKLTVGYTQLKLTGPDGLDIYEWVPRKTINLRYDTLVMPGLKLGVNGRWQSDVFKTGNARQAAYFVANGFVSYQLTDAATLRLNINNLFDKKYLGGLAYGAIYGAPRTGMLTLEYKL